MGKKPLTKKQKQKQDIDELKQKFKVHLREGKRQQAQVKYIENAQRLVVYRLFQVCGPVKYKKEQRSIRTMTGFKRVLRRKLTRQEVCNWFIKITSKEEQAVDGKKKVRNVTKNKVINKLAMLAMKHYKHKPEQQLEALLYYWSIVCQARNKLKDQQEESDSHSSCNSIENMHQFSDISQYLAQDCRFRE